MLYCTDTIFFTFWIEEFIIYKISIIGLFFLAFLQTVVYAEYHHVESCTVCHDFTLSSDPANNIRLIKSVIPTPNSGPKQVIFKDDNYADDNFSDFADGDAIYNGICEVCHTKNNHHNNDGHDLSEHFDGQKCTQCHLHVNEFAPPLQKSHFTHLNLKGKGPQIKDCTVCHQDPYVDPLIFRDGQPLETTTACDNCHSPWGAYPGGDEATALMDPVLGAKANFVEGIYEDDGYTIKPGKEKWCITCHDDRPSTSAYDSNPDPAFIVPTRIFEHNDSAMYFSTSADGAQSTWTQRLGAIFIDHGRCEDNWGDDYGWMTLDFNVSQDGRYKFLTKWDRDNSTCNDTAAGKFVTISVTDSNGTTTKTFEQNGIPTDFTEMATFDVVAGSAQLKVAKNNAQCQFNVGPIMVEPQGGSGGGTVVFAPMIAGDDKTWGFYATGHGVSGVQCTECHDPRKKHIDYNQRTFKMNAGYNVVNPWGDSYRLQTKDPIGGASLCGRCHDMEMIWDRGGKVTQTNFKNGTNGNQNLHAYHMALNGMQRGDADFDGVTDSDPNCLNCHNVHGSTKPHMFRDGNLASLPYTSSKKPMFEHAYEVYVKATWKPVLQGGSYEVFARWPAVAGAATNAPFTIKSSEIFSSTIKVDQNSTPNTWVSLGTYNFSDNNQSYVMLNDKETDGTVVADAVKFVSIDETVIVDNGDNSENGVHNYSTLDVNATLSGFTGYNGDYDAIAAGTTTFDAATSPKDSANTLLVEQRNLYIEGTNMSGIAANNICRSCHNAGGKVEDDYDLDVEHFTGPKIINRFEAKRWVLNDGTEDAEVYITVRDYDSNISSVTLDLTPIGGGVVSMTSVGKQLYHYTIPASMISALPDISYKLPVTATDTDGQVVTDETHLFPKDGKETIYLDTNGVELYNVHNFRFGVNTGGSSWKRLPSDTTYFGPGYRFEVTNLGSGNYGKWTPGIEKTGKYEVYAFWPGLAGPTTAAGVDYVAGTVKYTTYAADGTYEVLKDQTTDTGQWNYIGTYDFLDDDSNYVKQESSDGLAMVADAMKFVRVNTEPIVRLSAEQTKELRRIIVNNSNPVEVTAIATEYDAGDILSYDWSGSDAAIMQTAVVTGYYNEKLRFSPNAFAAGIYTVNVVVSDTAGASTTVSLELKVLESYPTLGAGDTDGDGVSDADEGFGDLDGDGIPNYLDSSVARNEIPDANGSVIVTENSMEIRIGSTAFAVGSDDGVITMNELNPSSAGGVFGGEVNSGGLFDFDILGLDIVGQSAKVGFALQAARIPAGATYQKYDAATGWQLFVIDANNAIHSAASVGGICPGLGSASYMPGLKAGDDCIQLTIQDGGPNDMDGLANAEVKDPGGIFAVTDGSTALLSNDNITYSGSSSVSSSDGGSGSFGLWTLLILSLFGVRSTLANRRR